MRHALALSLVAALLGGCASHKPEDYNGIWINQAAIDAASKGTGLRYALERNGPNFEWKVNVAANQASYSNGFELVEGRLKAVDDNHWQVELDGDQVENLTLDGKELVQATSEWAPEQHFQRSTNVIDPDIPPGATFEKALYGAYMKGDWRVLEGPGQGGTVRFRDNGSLDGLPNLDRYALCLSGDCATMTGKYDSLWLERNQQGNPWIFKRDGKQLEIFQAINEAQPDEMPELRPGARRWLLERK
ncbi:hypothetical protein V0R50_01280 [Pseudomonas sp. 148P]|uniref:Lipoprotein n=1 Tax=Pseudomonas ulcerans TaxID=3115852 RepID=A0ABU7HJZ4_9PSED|nr:MULTISPECIES: hypothetical protein [unclassified Pseudomonas]MEE1921553.1 hypothetical protein [Pseudomonas sp. 147P]MEE1931836.1 hypothetical protein [Pseudomonas sp. 148P]